MGKYDPKMHCSLTKLRFQFLHKTKNSSNWCAQQSQGIPCKMANLMFLTLYFLLSYFFVESAFQQFLENKIIKIMVPSKPQEPIFNNDFYHLYDILKPYRKSAFACASKHAQVPAKCRFPPNGHVRISLCMRSLIIVFVVRTRLTESKIHAYGIF